MSEIKCDHSWCEITNDGNSTSVVCEWCNIDVTDYIDAQAKRIKELEAKIVELVGLEKPTSARSISKIIADYETTPPCVENTYLIMECFRRYCWQEQTLDRREAWQKEAVEIFKSLVPTLEDQRCPHWHLNKMKELIEQAEAK